MKYHRIERGTRVFYINNDVFAAFDETNKTAVDHLMFSDFVVCTATNEVIKCRYPIERMMDQWLDIITK